MQALLFVALLAAAQNPTPTQVQQALQQQPGLADMVRGRIAQSGMTPDQIRARLSASGYPATLLDAYLTGTTAATGLTAAPSAQELAAIQALGLPAITHRTTGEILGKSLVCRDSVGVTTSDPRRQTSGSGQTGLTGL